MPSVAQVITMPDQRKRSEPPLISGEAQDRIAQHMREAYFPPDTSPISDEQLDLLLALRRKERERHMAKASGEVVRGLAREGVTGSVRSPSAVLDHHRL